MEDEAGVCEGCDKTTTKLWTFSGVLNDLILCPTCYDLADDIED